ncbi:unnamed protein product, partial [Closterium sp. Naga37s-1]
FQDMDDFEPGRRSCRQSLQYHNKRRRKGDLKTLCTPQLGTGGSAEEGRDKRGPDSGRTASMGGGGGWRGEDQRHGGTGSSSDNSGDPRAAGYSLAGQPGQLGQTGQPGQAVGNRRVEEDQQQRNSDSMQVALASADLVLSQGQSTLPLHQQHQNRPRLSPPLPPRMQQPSQAGRMIQVLAPPPQQQHTVLSVTHGWGDVQVQRHMPVSATAGAARMLATARAAANSGAAGDGVSSSSGVSAFRSSATPPANTSPLSGQYSNQQHSARLAANPKATAAFLPAALQAAQNSTVPAETLFSHGRTVTSPDTAPQSFDPAAPVTAATAAATAAAAAAASAAAADAAASGAAGSTVAAEAPCAMPHSTPPFTPQPFSIPLLQPQAQWHVNGRQPRQTVEEREVDLGFGKLGFGDARAEVTFELTQKLGFGDARAEGGMGGGRWGIGREGEGLEGHGEGMDVGGWRASEAHESHAVGCDMSALTAAADAGAGGNGGAGGHGGNGGACTAAAAAAAAGGMQGGIGEGQNVRGWEGGSHGQGGAEEGEGGLTGELRELDSLDFAPWPGGYGGFGGADLGDS